MDLEIARKTQQERFPKLYPRVAEILTRLSRGRSGRMVPDWPQAAVAEAARDHGITGAWPNSLLRSTFCSYALAETQNAAQVAEWTGHGISVLRKHYRRPVPKPEGKRFFALPGELAL